MNRLDAMLERLPPIYRISGGSVLHSVVAIQANHQAAFDEDMQRVQRSHWIDTALDRVDLVKLGALFDVPAMPWEPAELYRTRLRATIAARLRGAITRDVLEFVLIRIIGGVIDALGVRYMDVSPGLRFNTGATDEPRRPAFIEFPKTLRRSPALAANGGLLRSLERFELHNKGLFPVPVQVVLRGLEGGSCVTPVLINLTNGRVLAYAGAVPCGSELRIETTDRGRLLVTLNGANAEENLYSGTGFVPGERFSPIVPDATPEPLLLERGVNDLWFFPLALFNHPSLDKGIFGMPTLAVRHGKYGGKDETTFSGTVYDDSLFHQQPAVAIDAWWYEDTPASFRFDIPAGVVVRDADPIGSPEQDRLRLFELLQGTITLMRGAGIDGRVVARPLREQQKQNDRVRVKPPIVGHEQVLTEARLSALSGLFDTGGMDRSRFG